MRRVLVLRAREDAERTATALAARGFAPIVSPVLEIVATGATLPSGDFDAVLATSAKALQGRRADASAPLHVVGARTVETAAAQGWRVDLVAADAAALAEAILARHAGAPARFLYLAGHDRRAAFEAALRGAGHGVEVAVLYEAIAAEALAPAAHEAMQNSDIFAATHFSRRSAEIFLRLAVREGLQHKLAEMRHVAISEAAAEPLRACCDAVIVAEKPDEASILTALAAAARFAGAGA